jgi:hypothetical protein
MTYPTKSSLMKIKLMILLSSAKDLVSSPVMSIKNLVVLKG